MIVNGLIMLGRQLSSSVALPSMLLLLLHEIFEGFWELIPELC